MKNVTKLATAERSSLFGEDHQTEPHYGALIDALLIEVNVALGIEAALRCPDLDGTLLEGVQELSRIHVDRLREIGRLAEQVRP